MNTLLRNYFRKGLILFIATFFLKCQPKKNDVKDYVDAWEYVTTFRILPLHSITLVKKWPEATLGFAKLASGKNNVFVLSIEKKAIFRPDHSFTDLTNYRELWIELNPNDSLVTPYSLKKSKIYRQIIKMSPFSGAEILKPEEKIEVKRIRSNRWKVKSDLVDFQFEGEFSFADSSVIISRHKQMLTKDL